MGGKLEAAIPGNPCDTAYKMMMMKKKKAALRKTVRKEAEERTAA